MKLEKIKRIISNDKIRAETISKEKKYYEVENDILKNGVRPKRSR